MHPPTLSMPGYPADIFGDAAGTTNSRWLWGLGPFQLPLCYSPSWVKVVLVPGDAVAVPKGWWHAARSTPSSVAISVVVHIETVYERIMPRRMCRRDVQPVPAARGVLNVRHGSDRAPISRRAVIALGDDDPVVYYYALCDERLAASCLMAYARLEGRMIKWHTGDGLMSFAEAATADLGLSTRYVNTLADWMVKFQQRPKQGGVVLAEESAAAIYDEVAMTDEQHVNTGEPEQLQVVQY